MYLLFCLLLFFLFFFFFFQAEDGIRDLYVTGVQTCALPISAISRLENTLRIAAAISGSNGINHSLSGPRIILPAFFTHARSEERRVGKECRSRWSPYH